jgi:hypothetical protein
VFYIHRGHSGAKAPEPHAAFVIPAPDGSQEQIPGKKEENSNEP